MPSKKSNSRSASKSRRHSRSRSTSKSRQHSRPRSASKSRRHSRSRSTSKSRQHSRSRSTSKSRRHSRPRSTSKSRQHSRSRSASKSRHHLKCHAAIEYRGLNRKNDFVKNQHVLEQHILDYANKEKWSMPRHIPHDFISYVRNLQPVHQCKPEIFESICTLGHILSKEYREDLEQPKKAIEIATQHNGIRRLIPDLFINDAYIYITSLIEREYDEHNNFKHRENQHRNEIKEAGTFLKANLGKKTVSQIKDYAIRVAKAAITLYESKPGVNHDKDKDFGTDRHIFAILGPHPGNYGDIFIVFKRQTMLHPDANFSTTAATTYGHSANAYKRQPWLTDPGAEKERILCFHENKLHCSTSAYEYTAAYSLMASTGKEKKTMKVNLKKSQAWWCKQDPHFVFEARLPSRVPLDYIDGIYMPKNVYKSYSSELRKYLRQFFGRSLHVTKHDVDQSDPNNRGELTNKNSRLSYQKYVNDRLTKKFSRNTRNSSHVLRGTAITIAGSQFMEHVRLPTTIPQAYTQHLQFSKKKINKLSKPTTYIYWQAMWGDMMLTISNEPLTIYSLNDRKLSCLMCYIARIPSVSDKDYQESYSYITTGTPAHHKSNMSQRHYKVGSKTFHRGCKFDDYVTYRLKIERHNGRVTLSHAGRNNYHNKEKLICKFDKKNLDLNKLIYVHVSANEHPVPIRNLTIQFERAHRRRSSKHGQQRSSRTRRSRSRTGSVSSNRGSHQSRASRSRHRSQSASKGQKLRSKSVGGSKRSTTRHRSKSTSRSSHQHRQKHGKRHVSV